MKNPSQNTPVDGESDRRQTPRKTRQKWFKRPSAIVFGVTCIVLGVATYIGVPIAIERKVLPDVENQIETVLKRDVKLGKLERFSLTEIELGPTSIPATATSLDRADINSVKIYYNLLPLLLKRTLPVKIALTDVDARVYQDRTGTWLSWLQIEDEPLPPILVDLTVEVAKGKLAVLPNSATSPINVKADGAIAILLFDKISHPLTYDVAAELDEIGRAKIKGQTELETGESNLNASLKTLQLAPLSLLIPDLPVQLDDGELTADLKVELPSFTELPWIQGNADIQDIRILVPDFSEPVYAKSTLRFQGKKLLVEETRGSYGVLTANVSGDVDLDNDLNLAIDLLPVDLVSLSETLPVELPVEIDGEIQANVRVKGSLENPEITGELNNTRVTTIDKIELSDIRAQVIADLSQIRLAELLIKPVAGGEISGDGAVNTGLNSLEEVESIDPMKLPLAFDFQADLPVEAIASLYGLPPDVNISNLTATGTIRGTPETPQATLNWEIPAISTLSVNNISGVGDAILDNQEIRSQNRFQIGEGEAIANANGNLTTQTWQANISTTSLSLKPFLNLPVKVSPSILNASGKLDNFDPTSIQGSGVIGLDVGSGTLRGRGTLDAGKLNAFADLYQLELDELGSPIPINIQDGEIELSGQLNSLDPATIQATTDIRLDVEGGNVAVNGNLNAGNVKVSGNAAGVEIAKFIPDLSVPIVLLGSNFQVSGELDELLAGNPENSLTSLNGNANIQLGIAEGIVNGTGTLNSGVLQGSATASRTNLAEIIPDLPVPVTLLGGRGNISTNLDQLFSSDGTLNLRSLNAAGDAQLSVADSRVNAAGDVVAGALQGTATTSKLELARVIADLPIPVTWLGGKVNVSTRLDELLSADFTPDFNQVNATVDGKLEVTDGLVDLIGKLGNGEWNLDLLATDINTSEVIRQVAVVDGNVEAPPLPNLQGNVNLSGAIAPFLDTTIPLEIAANTLSVQLGEQILNANGNILLENITTAPDIANIALDIQANSQFESLPWEWVASQTGTDTELNVTGNAKFQGRFQGKNLISDPLGVGNANLTGNVNLSDFAINDIVFEPELTGEAIVASGEEISLDLRGKRDVIAAKLDPCTRQNCQSPYLPASLEIRQGEGSENNLLAVGKRQGDSFDLTVENFSLALLNVVPATQFGIQGPVTGEVTGNLDINLLTFETTGDINVDRPALGYIEAQRLAANFAYLDGIAKLSSAILELPESKYELQGNLNLNSGELDGELNIPQANIADIFKTFKWFSIADLSRVFQTPEYAKADDLQLQAVGNPDAPLDRQLQKFWEINNKIQALAARRNTPQLPTQIDVRGNYTGKINVSGSLSDPQAEFNIQGDNWEWHPQEALAETSEVETSEETPQVIPIDRVVLKGNYRGGTVNIEPMRVEFDDTVIAFGGMLSQELELAGEFELERFSVDIVRQFVEIPLDLQGDVNVKAMLAGTATNPQVTGNVSFVNSQVNGESLPEIWGDFKYADSRLDFNTTQPSSMQINASVPIPIQPGEDETLTADVKLDTEAIALIEPLTNGQVKWIDGTATVEIKTSGLLDLTPTGLNNLLAATTGEVKLADATIGTEIVPENLNITGNIELREERLRVENLNGEFAESKFSIAGVLPLLEPIENSDSDATQPLSLTIEKGRLNVKGLYKGQVDGQVIVTGTTMSPEIAGEVTLQKGKVTVPVAGNGNGNSTAVGATSGNTEMAIVPKLNNFRVILGDNFRIQRSPLFDFQVAGDLTVNGTIDDLRPEGVVSLQRGEVSVLGTDFFLARNYDHKVTFTPDNGVMNPFLDVRMETSVFTGSAPLQREANNNEIPDDSIGDSRSDRIIVTVSVNGEASEIVPALQAAKNCQPSEPLLIEGGVSRTDKQELERRADCINEEEIANASDRELLDAPIVELTSIPQRSKSEILALLGDQFVSLFKNIGDLDQEQLVELAITRYVVQPVLRDIIFEIDTVANNAGQKIGFTNFQVLPSLQGIRQLDDDSLVRFSYNYEFSEFQVNYEWRF